MAYIGAGVSKTSDIKRVTFATSTTGSGPFALGWTPDSEASTTVSINGVKQHDGSFTLSGANLTITETLVSGDELEVVGIAHVGGTIIPMDGSVSTAKLADDSVSTAKLADDSVTAAKVTLPLGVKILTGITTTYEITVADMADTTHLVVFFAASSSAYSIKCPTAANMSGKIITVINTVAGTGDVNLIHNAGGNITGLATNLDALPSYASVVSDGTNVYMMTLSLGGGSAL